MSVSGGVLRQLPPGARIVTLIPHAHVVLTYTSDFGWPLPKDANGTGCQKAGEFFDCLAEMKPLERALLLIQRPVDLGAMEALLREALGCGPFTGIRHPDHSGVTIRRVAFSAVEDPKALETTRARARTIRQQ